MRRDTLICICIGALIGIAAGLTYMAHPAYGQTEERCTVQVFDPPLESGWLMPGAADTVRVTFTDGTGAVFVGPFSIGDPISHPGLVAQSIEKCSGSGVGTPTPEPPTPTPEPTPTPDQTTQIEEPPEHTSTVPPPRPTAPPYPTPPGYEVPPTPPGGYPEPPFETVTPPPFDHPRQPHPTPTPLVELPRTGAQTGELVAVGLVLIAGGLMLATHRKWMP